MAQIVTQVLRRADMENSTFVDTSVGGEVYDAVNKSAEKLVEKLAMLCEDLFVKDATLSITAAGGAEYVLPSDMLSLRSVRLLSGGVRVPLERYSIDKAITGDRNQWGLPQYSLRLKDNSGVLQYWLKFDPPPAANYTVYVEYVWGWTKLTSATALVSLPFPEYIVIDAAMQLLEKEKTDISDLMAERETLERRIEAWARPRDHFGGAHILDVRHDMDWNDWDDYWRPG